MCQFCPSVASVQEGVTAWGRDGGGHHGLLLVPGLGAGCCSLVCFPGHDLKISHRPFSKCRIDHPGSITLSLWERSSEQRLSGDGTADEKTRGPQSSEVYSRLVSSSHRDISWNMFFLQTLQHSEFVRTFSTDTVDQTISFSPKQR